MSSTKQAVSAFGLIAIVLIYQFAWQIQTNIIFNWDVSWLMHVTQRMLAGGTYVRDFFEINPPMILFLYTPPVLLMKVFPLSIMLALRLYIFLLSTLSLVACANLLKRLWMPADKALLNIFLVVLALVYLILPLYEFGQREHIFILFFTPYLLLVCCQLQNKSVPRALALSISFFAALGLALKPYFLLPLFGIEAYYFFMTRRLRVELLLILSVIALYALSLVLFFKDYVFTIVPFVSHFYYSGFSEPWYSLAANILVIFCDLMAVFYFLRFEKNPYKTLSTLLLISMASLIIVFLMQHTAWYYHILPALSFGILLFCLLFYGLAWKTTGKFNGLLTAALGVLTILPLSYCILAYYYAEVRKESFKTLISYMHENALHKSVYVFSSAAAYTFPPVDYANADAVTRVAFLGWIPGMVKQEKLSLNAKDTQQLAADKSYLMNMLVEDLNNKKPEFIFVDVKSNKDYMDMMSFDYLSYFSTDEKFRLAFQPYHRIANVSDQPRYAFDVYQRNAG